MQTFLPYPSFDTSAACLDWQYEHNRLSNQIDEGLVILNTLLQPTVAVRASHPVFIMWRGYESALVDYIQACINTWKIRRSVTVAIRSATLRSLCLSNPAILAQSSYTGRAGICSSLPPWLGDDRLHSSHRSILLAKNPVWYGQFGWFDQPAEKNEKGKWPYYWPVLNPDRFRAEYLGTFDKFVEISGTYTKHKCPCGRGNIVKEIGWCLLCEYDRRSNSDHLEELQAPQ